LVLVDAGVRGLADDGRISVMGCLNRRLWTPKARPERIWQLCQNDASELVDAYPSAGSARAKMLLVDQLIHAFHYHNLSRLSQERLCPPEAEQR